CVFLKIMVMVSGNPGYIKKQMKDKGLFKSYTMMELLDELDSIEIFQHPNRKARFSEVTKKQKDIFNAMDVHMSPSLC
ncbi:hypothetical protein LJC22_02565, partial [Desulfosarcina sp. OttesenSCG-928-G10]|nr:hypothetical protein [Desulfosarcina sp. OttesenSCG-928-G10]